MTELINSHPDFSGAFKDKRISKRANQLLQSLTLARTSSLRQVILNDSEQKSFYRLFNNDNFTEQSIISSRVDSCSELSTGRHVLCSQPLKSRF